MRRIGSIVVGLALTAVSGVALGAPDPIEFGDVSSVAGADNSGSVVVADVTGDGKPDLVTLPRDAALVVIRPGRGDGTFGAPVRITTGGNPGSRIVRAARLNADAALDLVVDHGGSVSGWVDDTIADHATTPGLDVLLSDGSGGFAVTSYAASPSQFADGEVPSVADWDGDGDLDILSITVHSVFRVRLNDGAGGFDAVETTVLPGDRPDYGAIDLVGADFDGDGDTDLAMSEAGLLLFWRQADGSLSGPVWTDWARADRGMLAADVDGDHLLDIVMQSCSRAQTGPAQTVRDVLTVVRHTTPDTFRRSQQTAVELARLPRSLDIADLNGDARPEIVTPGALFVNRGNGTFGPPLALPATGIGVATCDVAGDARPDIVVVDQMSGATLVPVARSDHEISITSITPATFFLGSNHQMTIAGAGFGNGTAIDFGDGVLAADLLSNDVAFLTVPVLTETSLAAQVFIRPLSAPGPRVLTLINPDGGAASVEYALAGGGLATIESVTPSRVHAGDTVDFVVAGSGFVGDLEFLFGDGAVVNSTQELGEDRARVNVRFLSTARRGRRDVFIENGSGLQTFADDVLTVLPPRSLDVEVRRGKLRPGTDAANGSFTASGSFSFNESSQDHGYDSAVEAAEIHVGDPANPFVIPIPAGAGWRGRSPHVTWKSPGGPGPRVRFDLDFKRHTFRIEIERAAIPARAAGDVLVELVLGDETGTSVDPWTEARRGLELK